MLKYLAAIVILFIPFSLYAQKVEKAGIGIGFNIGHYPDFRLNDKNFADGTSYSLKLQFYNPDVSPLEYGAHFTLGYNQTVAFSYGLSFAYVFHPFRNQLLKLGLSLDKIEMKDYRTDYFVGGIQEDDTHESLNTYLEWELKVSQSVSFVMRAAYRFMRSETEYVEELISEEVFEDGTKVQRFRLRYQDSHYGAGFNYGFGLQVNF